jgi:hypothetical protein
MTLDNACFMYKERKKGRKQTQKLANSAEEKSAEKRKRVRADPRTGHTHGFNCQGTDERARCSHRLALDDMTNS